MRICVISPGVVHAASRTIAIADQFEEIHFIDIKCRVDTHELQLKGIICHGTINNSSGTIGSRKLQQLLITIKPDVIVCHYASGDHFFNAIMYGKCPVAVIAMGNDILYTTGDTHIPFMRRVLIHMGLRRVCYISSKSTYLSDRIKSYGVSCPIDVNYWGSDPDLFKAGNKLMSRKTLGLPLDKEIILSPRAIDPTYNIALIVESLCKIQETNPHAMLVMLGRSKDTYMKRIERIIAERELASSVLVVGEVNQIILPDYYNASDVVVSMASTEGFPNTLLEVMGCGIPVVVGEIPQIRELLTNGLNARLCNFNIHSIATSILSILNNKHEAECLAANGKKIIEAYADIRKNGDKFGKRIKEVCEKSNGQSFVNRFVFQQLFNLYRLTRRLPRITYKSKT